MNGGAPPLPPASGPLVPGCRMLAESDPDHGTCGNLPLDPKARSSSLGGTIDP